MLIISDMHSNIACLNAMWEKEKHADKIICLGDLVDFGFNPKEVIDWCRQRGVVCVAGNHDRSLANYCRVHGKFADESQAVNFQQYNSCFLGEEELKYLEALPNDEIIEADGIVYYFNHVYIESDMHYVKKAVIAHDAAACFEKIWDERVGDKFKDMPRRIVFGHTHQCVYFGVDGERAFLNPGSLSYRVLNDGITRGGDYIAVTDGDISFRHVDYDMSREQEICERLPLDGGSRRVCGWLFGKGN